MNKIVKIIFVFAICSFESGFLDAQTITWQKVYPTAHSDYGRDGIQTLEGGYIIIAVNQSLEGTAKLLKLDSLGNQEWERLVDTQGTIVSIKQTADSNFVIAGDGNNKGLLIKTDKLGNILWKKYYSINNELAGFHRIKITKNGDYIMCGVISFPARAYIVRTDSSGAIVWQSSYSNGNFDAIAEDLTETDAGLLYFTGFSEVNYHSKTLIGKLSNKGILIWIKSYGNEDAGDGQTGIQINYENESSLFVCGSNQVFFSYQGYFNNIDSSGNILFQKDFNTADGFVSMAKCYNGFALCGSNGNINKINLVKVDIKGNQISNLYYSFNTLDEITYGYSISLTRDNGFFMTGLTTYQGSDFYLNVIAIKTDCIGEVVVYVKNQIISLPYEFCLFQNIPNPFNSQTKIIFDVKKSSFVNISIFDISGKKIVDLVNKNIKDGRYDIMLNLNYLPSGIYFCKMGNNENFKAIKLILIK